MTGLPREFVIGGDNSGEDEVPVILFNPGRLL
jgi:hypothetical protein